ncbi:MAG: TonB-dependent receptor plug domain-containing protein, partial [Myxococcales bacterium]|nr:TonB-dependent receptor plug domain-containing protein [Myxococcales bacterium]
MIATRVSPWLPLAGLLVCQSAIAQGPAAPPSNAEAPADDLLSDDSLFELAPVTVTKQVERDDEDHAAGSVQSVSQATLEKMEYDDPHSVLLTVPGVYTRTEDAYGLRPNIGMRGGDVDRSKKLTLMEDGILIGPAAYSAPAAYYFPLMTRMVGVEVWKGPSAIRFGPQTVGGAINLISRDIPDELSGGVDLATGMYLYRKGHAWVGGSHGPFGILLEGVEIGSDGFKELDTGGNTGFDRQDFRLRARVQSDPSDSLFQRLEFLASYGHEHSNETYLGLTDSDFRATPYRRYAASEFDRMTWNRTEFRIRHTLEIEDVATIDTVAYRQDLSRLWRKVNGLRAGIAPIDILRDPTGRRSV